MAGEERTEAATPRKLQHLRGEGRVSKSVEVNSAVSILAGVLVLYAFGETSWGQFRAFLVEALADLARPDLTDTAMVEIGMRSALAFLTILTPLLLVMPVVGVVASVGQVGFLLSGKGITPQFEHVNPISGAKRLFSLRILVELVKTTLKVGIVGWLLYRAYLDSFPAFLSMAGADLTGALRSFADTAFSTAFTVGGAFLVLAAADYAYQRWDFRRNAKMTKQELKEEYKQSEGAPEIKAAIRRRQKRMAMSRMMQNVPNADVVVTNPTHFAVALSYRGDEMNAPKVIAKGQDLIAQRIKQIAREHDVPVVEDKPLAQALYKAVEVDQEIPYDLFQAVAGVLAYIYALKHRPGRPGATS